MKLPPPFKLRMTEFLGPELDQFIEALSSESPVSIRINQYKYPFDIAFKSIPWTQTGYYLPARPLFTADPLLHGGGYYVQEASSMFLEQAILQALPEREGLNVLDLCAAPGGKSTHLASLFSNGLLVSNEVIKSRVTILAENIQKWGTGNVVVTNNDPKDFKEVKSFFDCIVVDAPCSGEGMFRKNQNAIGEWSEENVQLCAQRQKRILADIWPALKPGGILVYSTCTYSLEENEHNLAWVCDQYDAENVKLNLNPDWCVKETEYSKCIGYRFYPHKAEGEGFFLAVVRKKGGTQNEFKFPKKRGKTTLIPMDDKSGMFNEILNNFDQWKLYAKGEEVMAFPALKTREIEYLFDALDVNYAGVSIGQVTKKELRPDHALALFIGLNDKYFPEISVTKEDALKFLRKDDLVFSNAQDGWNRILYNGLGLGWVKKVGHRFNNYYPKEWRIRLAMDKLQ
ncbi:methyltransferase RsmF C-terminal domain-like protein [Solitalea lacus]|uniref:methyltransferase RsmF C-terminal domain-like protein n=1 Tax=Solitalea lacus TaxID=2911172 RepID=UPI001EDAE7D3|nr:rRNA methyltransferase [Solitalea lacus]UKJ08672.1 rRNA methyltransferase [Solitalea lacus]